VVRIVEIDGKPAKDVRMAFTAPIVSAREINGQEQPVAGAATLAKGELVTSLGPYQPRSFAVQLDIAPKKLYAPRSMPVPLSYDLSVATHEGRPAEGCFDCSMDRPAIPQGKALPAEMLPSSIDYAGIRFDLADAAAGQPNALSANGQTIALPTGEFNRLYLLAAAANGDQKVTFLAADKPVELTIQEWTGKIGQWDDRIWRRDEQVITMRPGAPAPLPGAAARVRVNEYAEMVGLKPGFIKRADVAWFASHRHDVGGSSEPYAYSYLFAYAIDMPAGTKTLTLPDNDRIRILSITAADESGQVHPAQPLYDTLERP
jgi:alpha-mannosidase